jgi:hypothetical protein
LSTIRLSVMVRLRLSNVSSSWKMPPPWSCALLSAMTELSTVSEAA